MILDHSTSLLVKRVFWFLWINTPGMLIQMLEVHADYQLHGICYFTILSISNFFPKIFCHFSMHCKPSVNFNKLPRYKIRGHSKIPILIFPNLVK